MGGYAPEVVEMDTCRASLVVVEEMGSNMAS